MRDGERERVLVIIGFLEREYLGTGTTLVSENPLELLIATMLSAQCTDKRVNLVTGELFRKYKTAGDYADADLRGLAQDVRSTGFYKNKAKNIRNACRMLVDRYGSRVPDSMEELLTLPGVARKTANVVLANAYGIAGGVVVDTHVRRLSIRLGLTGEKDPVKIERDLMEVVSEKHWISFPHMLIRHGRKVCTARKPRCSECVLNKLCPSAFVVE